MKDEKINESDKKDNKTAKDVEENRAITFLSYLGFLCLIPLLAKKESKFAQFHAKQGLVLLIAWIIGGITIGMGIGLVINAGVVIFSIIGLINVNDGNVNDLPIIGDLAKKINI
ncbi:hypothetical protein HN784_04965 [bacterium]|jgi:uncharacterized membrane protein|nr:hypothetical protein [bacterium]MBT4250753.1 hypothetical protein [bacterium]MBT4598164.1 hypothetical protein [bacterium]MBT6753762.1 hypothetical protein [bacterium]MBT7037525.1 hypothetical protein [bacterium]